MGTNTILRNVLLLEGKDYTPEQIDDILKNKPVTMTIHEAITLNNRLRAINYATNIADRPSYAAALDLCKILGARYRARLRFAITSHTDRSW